MPMADHFEQERRVLLLANRSVFTAGVQSLLKSVDGLEIAMIAPDYPEAAHKLRIFDPDVIILNATGEQRESMAITDLLEQESFVMIITLDLSKTSIDVSWKRLLPGSSIESLLEAIQIQNHLS